MEPDRSIDANMTDRRTDGLHESTEPGRVSSSELLHGKHEIQIEHAGDIYRLRVTRSGKLILTK